MFWLLSLLFDIALVIGGLFGLLELIIAIIAIAIDSHMNANDTTNSIE